jgi:predicted double-glycine peptidase
MTCRRSATAAAAVLVLSATGVAAADQSGLQAPHSDASASTQLLDVPYLPQTEDLCGGAAVAMVLRYWGERQVYPEDFAALVNRSASGIRTDVLTSDVKRRGWQALPVNADRSSSGAWMRDQLDRGRPIIALVEVRPNRYHYVVIVAWTSEHVIVHDPARAPFRVLSRPAFDQMWAQAGRWALLLLPPERRPFERQAPSASVTTDLSASAGPCAPLVQEMVELSRAGDVGGAEAGLVAALRLCPQHSVAWRELAGVRFLQSRWAEASELAEHAALLDPTDEQGWNLLATSRFLNGEPDAALEAWNRVGRPSVDRVRVEGARRTRRPALAAFVNLPPRTLLTAEILHRAERRLRELPSAAVTSLRYRPVEGGFAEVEAAIVERPTVPRGIVPIVAIASRAWLQRELPLELAAPTGSGELWTAAWRWWEARPRFAFALAMPAPSGLPGVAKVEAIWERQSYAIPNGVEGPRTTTIYRDERRRTALSLADWATSNLRWEAGAAFDRWADGSHISIDGALDARLAHDRVSIGVDTAAWMPIGSGKRLFQAGLSSAWRSTPGVGRHSWLVSIGLAATSGAAPFDLWPGAGTGDARPPLLRAHPLLDNGVVNGKVFGRWLSHGTVEYQHPLLGGRGEAMRIAAFADAARAWRLIDGGGSSPLHTDVGAGVRVVLPGNSGTTRVDVARGLRDGRVVVSAGWQAPWPGR